MIAAMPRAASAPHAPTPQERKEEREALAEAAVATAALGRAAVVRVISAIFAAKERLGLTEAAMTQKAKPGARGTSTWDSWTDPTKEVSPNLSDVERFLYAVGLTLNVAPIGQDAPSVDQHGEEIVPEVEALIERLRALPERKQIFFAGSFLKEIEKAQSEPTPTDPSVEQPGPRARGSSSST